LERVVILVRRVEVNLGYVVTVSVEISKEVNSTWYLTQQVSFFAECKRGYRIREQEGGFVKGQTIEERERQRSA
jgi:hypothetical protein